MATLITCWIFSHKRPKINKIKQKIDAKVYIFEENILPVNLVSV